MEDNQILSDQGRAFKKKKNRKSMSQGKMRPILNRSDAVAQSLILSKAGDPSQSTATKLNASLQPAAGLSRIEEKSLILVPKPAQIREPGVADISEIRSPDGEAGFVEQNPWWKKQLQTFNMGSGVSSKSKPAYAAAIRESSTRNESYAIHSNNRIAIRDQGLAPHPHPVQGVYEDPFSKPQELDEGSEPMNHTSVDEIEFSHSLCQDKSMIGQHLPTPVPVDSEDDDFTCCLCHAILKNGKECRFCEQHFCLFCIEKQVIKTGIKGCPGCGQNPVDGSKFYAPPSKFFLKHLSKIEVKCSRCKAVMDYGRFQTLHMTQCKEILSQNCGDSVIEVSDTSMCETKDGRRLTTGKEPTLGDLKNEIKKLQQQLKSRSTSCFLLILIILVVQVVLSQSYFSYFISSEIEEAIQIQIDKSTSELNTLNEKISDMLADPDKYIFEMRVSLVHPEFLQVIQEEPEMIASPNDERLLSSWKRNGKWHRLIDAIAEEGITMKKEHEDGLSFGPIEHLQMLNDQRGIYVGEIVDGQAHGLGRAISNSWNEMWEGQFENNTISGFGRYYYATGWYYIGYMENGKKVGPGNFYRDDGTIYNDRWSN